MYKQNIRRYICKDCNKTFNDKTGTVLHYKQIDIGRWMLSVWLYLCGPLNGISINYISQAIGRTYRSTYYMIRDVMDRIENLQERMLSGESETDEMYLRTTSKGVPLKTNGEDRTLPSRRALPRGPRRGTFKKNIPMVPCTTSAPPKTSKTGPYLMSRATARVWWKWFKIESRKVPN